MIAHFKSSEIEQGIIINPIIKITPPITKAKIVPTFVQICPLKTSHQKVSF